MLLRKPVSYLLFFLLTFCNSSSLEKPRKCRFNCTAIGLCSCTRYYHDQIITCAGQLPGNGPICFDIELSRQAETIVLQLSHGNMTRLLPDDIFPGYASYVKDLDVSHNQISTLADESFTTMTKLEKLSLNNNRIGRLTLNSFKGLGMVTFIDLEHNNLVNLQAKVFERCSNLTDLRLSNNPLAFVHMGSFLGLNKLERLDVSNTRLKSVRGLFNLPRLVAVWLHNSKLTRIPSLFYLPQLRFLDLSRNPIQEIAAHSFTCLRNLRVILLNNLTSLELIHDCAFCGPIELELVDIRFSSKLKHLSNAVFGPIVYHLNISGGNFSTIENLGNVVQISMNENQWLCDCNLRWIKDRSVNLQTQIRCLDPPELSGLFLDQIPPEQLVCNTTEMLPILNLTTKATPSAPRSNSILHVEISDWQIVVATLVTIIIVLIIGLVTYWRIHQLVSKRISVLLTRTEWYVKMAETKPLSRMRSRMKNPSGDRRESEDFVTTL